MRWPEEPPDEVDRQFWELPEDSIILLEEAENPHDERTIVILPRSSSCVSDVF